MFDMRKFDGYISRLRKKSDMTQSELAEKLNVTRQAVSKYENGCSFPDVSILALIAEAFGVTLGDLINSGEPTRGEASILENAANGGTGSGGLELSDLNGVAPLLKPSVLEKLSHGLSDQGIDISSVVSLSEYLSEDGVLSLLENADFNAFDDRMLEKLMPFLDARSKLTIFQKILDGELDWHMIKALTPYAEYLSSPIEAAVIEGALPWEALRLLRAELQNLEDARRRSEY